MRTIRWQDTFYLGIRDAVGILGCTWEEMNGYVDRGLVRLSNHPLHRRRRVVLTADIKTIADKLEYERYGVPVANLPPRTGVPNCVLYTPAIRPPRMLPVPMPPTKAFYVYVLRLPNGSPFYVGKGTRDRPYEHINEAVRGECICRKCKVIQLIHKMRREVLITYEFEADSAAAALAEEKRLIRMLCREYQLTNRSGNPYYDRDLPAPKLHRAMTREEMNAHLDRMPLLTKHDRERRMAEWREDRIEYLEQRWRTCRRQYWGEEEEQINAELDALRTEIGDVVQRTLQFEYSKPPRRSLRRMTT